MSAATEIRADLVKRCRLLELRYIRIANDTGKDCTVAIQWARQWASALIDTRCPSAMYANWIGQQEVRADRMENLNRRVL